MCMNVDIYRVGIYVLLGFAIGVFGYEFTTAAGSCCTGLRKVYLGKATRSKNTHLRDKPGYTAQCSSTTVCSCLLSEHLELNRLRVNNMFL